MKLLLLLSVAAWAQDPPKGTVRGVIRDFATGDPLPGAQIRASVGTGRPLVSLVAGERGVYELKDVDAGVVTIGATPPSDSQGGPFTVRAVTVAAGQELSGIDVKIRAQAELSGRILDENKNPVPGVAVQLVAREHYLGEIRYVATRRAVTDDRGEYLLRSVDPGRSFLLLVNGIRRDSEAISTAPADPKLRRPAIVPSYYPGVDTVEGAQPLVLQPSERRENVDLRVLRGPSYCASGKLSGPSGLRFDLAEKRPSAGRVRTFNVEVNWRVIATGTPVGENGEFRLCDLHPGEYVLSAYSAADQSGPLFYGSADVRVTSRDIDNITATSLPQVAVPGEIVWADAPPPATVTAKLTVRLDPLVRAPRKDEVLNAEATLPGSFTIGAVFAGEYAVQVAGLPTGMYVQDLVYAGRSVLRAPVGIGSAAGAASLRVVVGRDSGRLRVQATDRDGNPMPEATVLAVPAAAGTPAEFAAAMTGSFTDQNGSWTSRPMPPGKYLVLSGLSSADYSSESVERLWRARSKGKEVEVTPGNTSTVTVTALEW